MENTTQHTSFVKKCILAVVIVVATIIGLTAMPILASASTTTLNVNIESEGMSLNITNPHDGYTTNNNEITLTIEGNNVGTIWIYLDDTSSTPIGEIIVNEDGSFSIDITVTLPPGLNNGEHQIIIVGDNATGDPETKTSSVDINFTGAQPIIDTVSPPSGSIEGGDTIIIKGDNFRPDSQVTIGGKKCVKLTYIDRNTLKCVTPPHSAGNVDIVVTNPGVGSITMREAFRYVDTGVLVPDTGLFRIGNKMISVYELIGMIAFVIAVVAVIVFLLIGGKKKQNKSQKKPNKTTRKTAKRKVAKRKTPPAKRKTRR